MHEASVTHRDRALLAHIDPFASGSLETRLIYPRHAPEVTAEKIKLFLLKPLMKLVARSQVQSFLSSDKIRDLDAAKHLLTNIRKNPFRSVSESELSAVLAEAAMNNVSISGNFSGLIQSHFRNPDHLEQAFHQLLHPLPESRQKALTSFMAFVRDPSAPLDRRDKRGIERLLGEIHAKNPPAALADVLSDYQAQYADAYDNAAKLNSFGDATNKDELSSACNELHDHLPPNANGCIDVFEQFTGSRKVADGNRSSLQKFLTHFSYRYAALSAETILSLLPHVIAAKDALEGKTLLHELSVPEEIQKDEKNFAMDLLFAVRGNSKYSPSAALALIEYLALKGRIKTLQAEIARSDNLLSGANKQKSPLFEKQKIAALMKGRTPTRKAKKAVLAYKGVWTSATRNLEAKRAELSNLKSRLINPESRVRLSYVVTQPDLLLQSLPSVGDKSRATAKRVLAALAEDLKEDNQSHRDRTTS